MTPTLYIDLACFAFYVALFGALKLLAAHPLPTVREWMEGVNREVDAEMEAQP